jgi:hypothetical protein
METVSNFQALFACFWHYEIQVALVLRPSCVPDKVGVNQKYSHK